MELENKTSLFVFSWHLLCHQSSLPSFLSFCHLSLWQRPKPHTTTLNSGSDLFGYYYKAMFSLGCRSCVFCVHSSTYWVLVTEQVKFLTAHYLEVSNRLGACITSRDPKYNCGSCNCCTISVY